MHPTFLRFHIYQAQWHLFLPDLPRGCRGLGHRRMETKWSNGFARWNQLTLHLSGWNKCYLHYVAEATEEQRTYINSLNSNSCSLDVGSSRIQPSGFALSNVLLQLNLVIATLRTTRTFFCSGSQGEPSFEDRSSQEFKTV